MVHIISTNDETGDDSYQNFSVLFSVAQFVYRLAKQDGLNRFYKQTGVCFPYRKCPVSF